MNLKSRQPLIKHRPLTRLIGIKASMSHTNNQTARLWQTFMPRKKEINNAVNTDLYSIELYPENYFQHFNPNTAFEKWAAVPVKDFQHIPEHFDTLEIPEGTYACFEYKGGSSEGLDAYRYIYVDWIPNSGYQLDDRPHFAVMGSNYKNDHPDSEEELWIPIRKRH